MKTQKDSKNQGNPILDNIRLGGGKVLRAIKERRLIRSTRNYLAQKIAAEDSVLTSRMNYIKPSRRPKCRGNGDYVRVASLELVAREIKDAGKDNVPVAELGVYRGDFAKLINAEFPKSKLYLFDTFEGFDSRDVETERRGKLSAGDQDFTGTSVEGVLAKMPNPENCVIRKGWFPQTADGLDEKFVFVSIDADLFDPIYEGLRYFYPRLEKGGYIFVHDYNNWEYRGSMKAVRRFCRENEIPWFPLADGCGSAVIAK